MSLALLKGSLVWNRVSFLMHTAALTDGAHCCRMGCWHTQAWRGCSLWFSQPWGASLGQVLALSPLPPSPLLAGTQLCSDAVGYKHRKPCWRSLQISCNPQPSVHSTSVLSWLCTAACPAQDLTCPLLVESDPRHGHVLRDDGEPLPQRLSADPVCQPGDALC